MQDGGQTEPKHEEEQQVAPAPPRRSWLYLGILVAVAVAVGGLIWWVASATIDQSIKVAQTPQAVVPTKSTATPQLTTEQVANGYDHVWEIAFLPSKEMLFTERKGVLHIVKEGKASTLAAISDVRARGEGGLLGLAVDPDFANNRYIYTCFNSTQEPQTIRVVRWKLPSDLSKLDSRTDIITDIPSNNSPLSAGRHSGCRLAFGPDGYLWVGTGDTAQGDTSIQPKNLGGKILRVDRDGKGAPGNQKDPYDSRIYSYGHRNVQGLAFFAKAQEGVLGISVEHGSSVDDEVNILKSANFGWAPAPGSYVENVPMTDKKRFPDAIDPIWNSGSPTQAPSGATFLRGGKWKGWDGALAVAMLKTQHLKILKISPQNKVAAEERVLEGQFKRLRTAVMGPDGNLYIGTDNGSTDQIIRVIPH
jgi:aldose sugar dehydrogenase